MADDFRDQQRDAVVNGGSRRLWIATALDLLRRAPREHADVFWRDAVYAFRTLRQRPGFTFMAVLILGLGIGANTSIFSLLNAILLRPVPVADPEHLVVIRRGSSAFFSYPDYREYQASSTALTGLAAAAPWESDLASDDRSEFITKEGVSGNYSEVVGVRAEVGTWFNVDDELVAVVSHHVWQDWFNRDPQIVGRQIRTGSRVYTIVGVAPAGFLGARAPLRTDLWVPMRTWQGMTLDDRSLALMMMFGRLRPDVSAESAAAELNAIDTRLPRDRQPSSPLALDVLRATPDPALRDISRAVIVFLTAVVGLVLAIACVNVGNLLLVRGAARQRELAVRRALGASSGRLFRQLLTETFVLALGGGLCGLVVARWTNDLLTLLTPAIPAAANIQLNLTIDRSVLAFTAGISIVTTLVCGLLPAWRISRTRALTALKGEQIARSPLGGRTAALVGQVTVSLVLLFVAGTFLRGLWNLQTADPGFAIDDRVYAWTYLPDSEASSERGRQFYARALDRVRSLPGVQSAALTYILPLSTVQSDCVFHPNGEKVQVTTSVIDGGFLSTMRIGLVSGREFSAIDTPDSPAVVIVNQTLVRRLWPAGTALDQSLLVGCQQPRRVRIVGVARDSQVRSLQEPPGPHIYQPFAQNYTALATLVVESRIPTDSMVDALTRTLRALGDNVRVYTVAPVSDHVGRSYFHIRWAADLITIFSSLALGLAALGLYGLMAYRTALRTREIGIRIALGARPADILRHVLGQGLLLVLVGVVVGTAVSAGLTRALARVQEGILPTDPATYLITAAIWMIVAVLACYLPARRAARVDPLLAIRME